MATELGAWPVYEDDDCGRGQDTMSGTSTLVSLYLLLPGKGSRGQGGPEDAITEQQKLRLSHHWTSVKFSQIKRSPFLEREIGTETHVRIREIFQYINQIFGQKCQVKKTCHYALLTVKFMLEYIYLKDSQDNEEVLFGLISLLEH